MCQAVVTEACVVLLQRMSARIDECITQSIADLPEGVEARLVDDEWIIRRVEVF